MTWRRRASLADRPGAAAELAVRLSTPLADLPEDAPPRVYLASRGIVSVASPYLRWLPREAWGRGQGCRDGARPPGNLGALTRALRGYPETYPEAPAAGMIVFRWIRPNDPYGPAIVEVEGVAADGSRVAHEEGHKRHTLPGKGIGSALFLPRPLRPFARRLHLVEGALDALALVDLGLADEAEDVVAVHGCAGMMQPAIVAACRARTSVVIYPHGGDKEDIGEVKARELADAIGPAASIVTGPGDLNEELDGTHPRRTGVTAESRIYPLSDVRPTWQPMIWRPWLPAGSVAVVAGSPGHGKTLALVSIAAAMTRGHRLPGEDETTQHDPSTVGWLSIEEDPATVIAPRMKAAGADAERVLLDRLPLGERRIGTPEARDVVEAMAARCRMLVIDSLEAWTPDANLSKPTEARKALGWLLEIAVRFPRCAFAVIHHDRKGTSAEALTRVSGSRQVTATPESVIVMARTGAGEECSTWWTHAKCRVAGQGDTWRVEIRGSSVMVWDPEREAERVAEHGVLHWVEQRPEMTADVLARAGARAEAGGSDAGGASDTEQDREDATALAAACRSAHAAGLEPGRTLSRGDVVWLSLDWLDVVGESCGRASGRRVASNWPRKVLAACGVRADGRHRFPEGEQRAGWRLDQVVALAD